MLAAGEIPVVWRSAVLLAFLFVAACAAPGVVDPTPAPSGDPTASLAVPPGPVLFEPEQLIFPPEDFPLAGAEVARDAPLAAHGWERQFATPASGDFRWFTVRLYVFEPDVRSTRFIEENGCGAITWADEQPSWLALSAPRTGEGARACRYRFADGARVLYYATGYRNVGILVGTQPRRDEVSDALALDWAVAIARQQIAIIGGVLVAYPPPEFPAHEASSSKVDEATGSADPR